MNEARDILLLLMAKLPSVIARYISAVDVGGFLSVLILVLLLDRYRNRGERYRQRAFRVDLVYSFFYLGGIFTLFVGLPVYRLWTRIFDSLFPKPSEFLSALPVVMQVMIGLLVVDIFAYAWHRSVHANRFLWAFHSVHHSQRYLTVATGFRMHFVDEIIRTSFMFVPLYFLGIKPHSFVIADLIVNWVLALQHSDLTWSYGVFGKVIVSPGYHRVHHSLDVAYRDKNFSVLFPFWDRLFRTYVRPEAGALEYGIDAPIPESFFRQMAWPFVVIARALSGRRSASLPPSPAAEST